MVEHYEFRLLGPIEADIDSSPANLGHTRQKAVLAALLVDPGARVGDSEMCHRIWNDATPRTAPQTLQSYVSRLRTAIAPSGARIERICGGYRWSGDPHAVDLHRFRTLAARARRDPAGRYASAEAALELWRGEPFGGIDAHWFWAQRSSLHREYHELWLDKNDGLLARRLHHRLIPELVAATEDHPFDERLSRQYMTALYLSGRQNEAFGEYRRLRDVLRDELGTGPQESTVRLHRSLLRGELPPARGRRRRRGVRSLPETRRAGRSGRAMAHCTRVVLKRQRRRAAW
ncbi:AfsR/SARP family transcriptional regulator [Salininema proteolyticum]|uniref:BTAD domain-containing putative transcriptional regulator n=1 Tax=Salininema proteolyticum TaxID=1607685 RepID=A0ABV8TSW3_9ACTN